MSQRLDLVIKSKLTNHVNNSFVFNLHKITTHQHNYHKTLWLFGVNTDGLSVAIKVTNFNPTLLIKCPDYLDDCEEALKEYVHEELRIDVEKKHVKECSLVVMTPFVGFTNLRKDKLVKLRLEHVNSMRAIQTALKDINQQIYHADDPVSQFLNQKKIKYGDWLQINNFSLVPNQSTHCNIEGNVKMGHISKSNNSQHPRYLKLFIRIKMVSQDAVIDDANMLYHPDPRLECDRIMCIQSTAIWSTDLESKKAWEKNYTLLPLNPSEHNVFTNEADLLESFSADLRTLDPDVIVYMPDYYDVMNCLITRCDHLGIKKTALCWDRFKNTEMYYKTNADGSIYFNLETRSLLDIEAALQEKVFIQVESYDLLTVSASNEFRKNPFTTEDSILSRNTSYLIKQGYTGWLRMCKTLQQEVDLLIYLERDMGCFVEYTNLSCETGTSFTDTVSRGQQLRVWNTLTRFCLMHEYYINKEKLIESKPLRFNIKHRPPTYPDPDELQLNVDLRNNANVKLREKANYWKAQSNMNSSGTGISVNQMNFDKSTEIPDEVDEVDGGNVVKPAPKYYDDEILAVLDFASLYPSIMIMYNITYENIVFEEEYLDLPGVKYVFAKVNRFETVAIAQVPGILQKLQKQLLDTRVIVKKLMKCEKDPFKKKILDSQQNTLKVVCNSVYGFCGANADRGFMPMKDIMYIVTSLGRYLQKICSHCLGHNYNIPTVYGDTDSIFITLPHHKSNDINEVCYNTGKMYKMADGFTWEFVVDYYANRTNEPLDILVFLPEHQLHAILYLCAEKISQELTDLFDGPIVMEMENLATKCYMADRKKYYCYLFWDEKNPSKVKKTKVTGMPEIKRGFTTWTRKCLQTVRGMILSDKLEEIEPYLHQVMTNLITRRVSVHDLKVTRKFKNHDDYKSMQQIHLQVIQQWEHVRRWRFKNNSRIYYVVIEGKDKMYLRGMDPDDAVEQNTKIDVEYYLKDQFCRPMKVLLMFHTHLFDFEKLCATYIQKLKMDKLHMVDISQRTQKRRMEISDLSNTIRKKTTNNKILKVTRPDPFAKFYK